VGYRLTHIKPNIVGFLSFSQPIMTDQELMSVTFEFGNVLIRLQCLLDEMHKNQEFILTELCRIQDKLIRCASRPMTMEQPKKAPLKCVGKFYCFDVSDGPGCVDGCLETNNGDCRNVD
jgi:hypothetical protein